MFFEGPRNPQKKLEELLKQKTTKKKRPSVDEFGMILRGAKIPRKKNVVNFSDLFLSRPSGKVF